MDDPGDHGANEPWVACRHRTRHVATDPLGPVISHGILEAPGFRPGLLSLQQAWALGRASLRLDSIPGSVLYEHIRLARNPTEASLASLVRGAITLAGRALPGTPAVNAGLQPSTHPMTPDAAGTWQIEIDHDGVAISGAYCDLVSSPSEHGMGMMECQLPEACRPSLPPVNVPAGTSASIVLPLPSESCGLTFESFTLSDAEATQAARDAADLPHGRAEMHRQYEVHGTRAAARYVGLVWSSDQSFQVQLDGHGDTVSVDSSVQTFVFNGWGVDYPQGESNGRVTQIPVGPGQTNYLDSEGVVGGNKSCGDGTTGDDYAHGFVICANGMAAIPGPGHLLPRADGDFTGQDPAYTAKVTVGPGKEGLAPAAPFMSNPDFHLYTYGTPGNEQRAAVHQAEMQAFYSAGALQKWYGSIGYPLVLRSDLANAGDTCAPGAPCVSPTQDPFRLEIKVHAPGFPGSSNTGHVLTMSDEGTTGNDVSGAWLDGVTDGTVFAHEYQHHIQAWMQQTAHWQGSLACNGCTRGAVLEGLGDAFAGIYTGRDRLGMLNRPKEGWIEPCANPDAYPDNSLADIAVRNLCNSVVYNYWKTSDFDPVLGGWVPHRRGTILAGALRQYWGYYKDAGISLFHPALEMFEAAKRMTVPNDDERTYLHHLLFLAKADVDLNDPDVSHILVSFEEKNIFGTAVSYDHLSCDGGSACTAADATTVAQQTLAMAGPLKLTGDPANQAPGFNIFTPTGNAFQHTSPKKFFPSFNYVQVTLADNASFSSITGTVFTDDAVYIVTWSNNSRYGFFRYKPPTAGWQKVANAATAGGGRIYYRVRVCLSGGAPCIYSTQNGAASGSAQPFVAVSSPGNPGCGLVCSMTGRRHGGRYAWLAGLFGLAFVERRRRSRRRSRS